MSDETPRTLAIATRIDDVEQQLNRRIETQLRELSDLRTHFNAILTEKDRAIEMADREREKAAVALATALERAIHDGDERLREHIANQIAQINAALSSAEKLEIERIASVRSELATMISAGKEAVDAAFKASEQAIEKAEINAEKWRDNANEWRGQSADRERTQAEQIATLTQSLMPRELAEAQIGELRKLIGTNQDLLKTGEGRQRGISDSRAAVYAFLGVLLTVAVIVSPHIK